MALQIPFNNKVYTLDIEEIEVEHARVIKRYAGLTLRKLEESLAEGDPDGLTSLYWLMLKQSGENHNIESVSFKIVKFAKAVADAQAAEAAELAAKAKAEAESAPKDERDAQD
jgi:hypothetical protein